MIHLGYGPETLSVQKWINFESNYKNGGKFTYKVNWRRDGNVRMDKLGADIKLFLNSKDVRDFVVKPDLNGVNRLDEDWYAFNITLDPILGKKPINENNLICVDIPFSSLQYTIDNDKNIITYKKNHHKEIFKIYDFYIEVFDKDDNKIDENLYSINKNISNFSYEISGVATTSSNKIKFYLNKDFKNNNVIFFETDGKNTISFKDIFYDKNIPFLMYSNVDDEPLIEVKYKYSNIDYNSYNTSNDKNLISSFILNKKYYTSDIAKIKYILGINDDHNYSEFMGDDNVNYFKISEYDSFLYQENYELKNILFKYNNEIEKFKIIGNFSYDSDIIYTFNNFSYFNINIFPYSLYSRTVELNNVHERYQIDEILVKINLYETNKRIIILRGALNSHIHRENIENDELDESNIDLTCVLTKFIIIKDGEEYTIDFDSYWDSSNLNIIIKNIQNTNNEIVNFVLAGETCKLYFTSLFIKLNRSELNLDNRAVKPNIYVYQNINEELKELSSNYYYIWNSEELTLFLTDLSLIYNSEISSLFITSIDYFNIYTFNINEINKFTKNLIFNTKIVNYDDEIFDAGRNISYYDYSTNDYVYKSIEGQKNPLYWLNCNLYDDEHKLCFSKTESSTSGYQLSNAETQGNNSYDYYMGAQYPALILNENIKAFSESTYNAVVFTKFKLNNFKTYIKLYDGNITLDTSKDENFTLEILWPFVNFYGNFVDGLKNSYSNDRIRSEATFSKSFYSYDSYGEPIGILDKYPKLTYKMELQNVDQNLSADLKYVYKNPLLDKIYSFNYNLPYYYENDITYRDSLPYFNFMFKHSAFIPISDDYYENSVNGYYNQNLYSIYPGIYKIKTSLYKYKEYCNDYRKKLGPIYNEDEIYLEDNTRMAFIKENESLSSYYNYKYELPLITVSGVILNRANNKPLFGQDLQVELINTDSTKESYKFIYDCFIPKTSYYEKIDYSNIYHYNSLTDFVYNRLINKSFLFKLFGLDRPVHPYDSLVYKTSMIEIRTMTTEDDNKHHEPGVLPGNYILKASFKDNVFYSKEIEISKEAEKRGLLSSIIIDSPYIDFNGRIVTSFDSERGNITYKDEITGSILVGDNWSINIINSDTGELERRYRYAYSLKEDQGGETRIYRKTENLFKFNNLPLSTICDLNNEYFSFDWNSGLTPSSEWSLERSTRYALLPGIYNIQVKYKNKIMQSFNNIEFSKETDNSYTENEGYYENARLKIGDVVKSPKFRIIDGQFNEEVEYTNRYYMFSPHDLLLYDEQFDDNLAEDNFNTTSFIPVEYGSRGYEANNYSANISFKDLVVGYYRIHLLCYYEYSYYQTYRMPLDDFNIKYIVSDNITDNYNYVLNGLPENEISVYKKLEDWDENDPNKPKFDLLDLSKLDQTKTYKIILSNWFTNFSETTYYVHDNVIKDGFKWYEQIIRSAFLSDAVQALQNVNLEINSELESELEPNFELHLDDLNSISLNLLNSVKELYNNTFYGNFKYNFYSYWYSYTGQYLNTVFDDCLYESLNKINLLSGNLSNDFLSTENYNLIISTIKNELINAINLLDNEQRNQSLNVKRTTGLNSLIRSVTFDYNLKIDFNLKHQIYGDEYNAANLKTVVGEHNYSMSEYSSFSIYYLKTGMYNLSKFLKFGNDLVNLYNNVVIKLKKPDETQRILSHHRLKSINFKVAGMLNNSISAQIIPNTPCIRDVKFSNSLTGDYYFYYGEYWRRRLDWE